MWGHMKLKMILYMINDVAGWLDYKIIIIIFLQFILHL
jgi:hypothetical protein